jgi:hypothetical protein
MDLQNVNENGFMESENYTCVSPDSLKMIFPMKVSPTDIIRERPTAPLRERSEREKAQLRNHPFFSTD